MANVVEIGRVITFVVDELAAGTPVLLDVYPSHQVPSIPPRIPYLTVYSYMPGDGWDDAPLMRASGRVGWVGVIVTSVGRADVDALYGLDEARRVMSAMALQPIPGTHSTMNLASVESLGPPSQPARVASLVTTTETFRLYVEAP
jgi:hypothetical protein